MLRFRPLLLLIALFCATGGWAQRASLMRSSLANVRMPVLLLVGTKDMVYVGRVSTYLKQHLPNAREVRFHGAAHMLNPEQPDFFNKTVRAFLSKP